MLFKIAYFYIGIRFIIFHVIMYFYLFSIFL